MVVIEHSVGDIFFASTEDDYCYRTRDDYYPSGRQQCVGTRSRASQHIYSAFCKPRCISAVRSEISASFMDHLIMLISRAARAYLYYYLNSNFIQ